VPYSNMSCHSFQHNVIFVKNKNPAPMCAPLGVSMPSNTKYARSATRWRAHPKEW
jgi:hypothetical protein